MSWVNPNERDITFSSHIPLIAKLRDTDSNSLIKTKFEEKNEKALSSDWFFRSNSNCC